MTRPIRPFLFVPRYWPGLGGAELHSRRLAHELARHVPIEVGRCCSTEEAPTDFAFATARAARIEDGDVAVHTLAPAGAARALLSPLAKAAPKSRLARLLFARAARAVITEPFRRLVGNASIVHAIYNGFTPGAEALQSLGQPFVFTPLAHTTKPDGTAWSSPGFKHLYRKTDALIAMTEYEREWLIGQGAQSSRVHVCPMAPLFESDVPDPVALRARFELGEAPVILFLGRTAEYKGYRTLLDAASQIWAQQPEARLVFAGPVTPEAEVAFRSRPDPRIIITGTLSGADKKSVLAACDLLCVPSTEESLGVVFLEAWSFDKPVIAADIPAMRSVIEDGEDGVLVRQDATAVATAITDLLGRPSRAKRMGQQGARKVDAQYNWAAIADAHLRIYQSII
ncbi:glycosyltransferase family 4 protein [Maricaulis sp.]|uniref:glycosyltransferase family 4 protein n=1 Tax=Maricaulis sp. TaxID=1486257 RepID=UPI0025C72FA1|nr:glycosyltransferase family 4 protein [Maricaulis sp.]